MLAVGFTLLLLYAIWGDSVHPVVFLVAFLILAVVPSLMIARLAQYNPSRYCDLHNWKIDETGVLRCAKCSIQPSAEKIDKDDIE